MILPLIILYNLAAAWPKQIESKPQIHISVEVGQAYNQNIPLLFKRFQHTTLTNIKRDTIYYELPVCEIRPASPALLRQVTHLKHNSSKPLQEEEIVYRFEELSALRVFIDAIYYQQYFIVLYKLNELVIYSFSQQKGFVDHKTIIKIPGDNIQQGQFAINQGTILLFMSKRVIRIDKDSFKVVEGYKQMTGSIDDIRSIDEYIYIAGGNEGVITYKYDNNGHTLSLVSNTKIYDQTGNTNTSFDANRLHIDPTSRIAFILDRQQGVVSASLDKIHSGGEVKGSDFRVLMGGCEKMLVSASSIYLTCPELVKLNKQSGVAEKVSRNNFYAYEMELSDRRLFLYGHQEIAVYDIMGNIAQQFSLDQIVQKSFLIGDYLVTFSNRAVSSYMLISQQEELHCYTASQDRKGVYHGRYVTRGLCSQYFQAPQNNSDFCQVDYPFTIKIEDSAFDDYKIEIIVVLGWIVLSGIIALAMVIRHRMVHKTYKELVEEESRENIEFVPKVEMQKRREEEVVE